jgi:hypothetical protein
VHFQRPVVALRLKEITSLNELDKRSENFYRVMRLLVSVQTVVTPVFLMFSEDFDIVNEGHMLVVTKIYQGDIKHIFSGPSATAWIPLSVVTTWSPISLCLRQMNMH